MPSPLRLNHTSTILPGKVILATVGYDDEEFDALIRTIEKTLEN